uniref:Uncharacterized protein n=1 Tax=Lepeophtheirus salmonis TaxID=72036 RepID=A0A0K2V857_LEPSM
MLFFILSLFE